MDGTLSLEGLIPPEPSQFLIDILANHNQLLHFEPTYRDILQQKLIFL